MTRKLVIISSLMLIAIALGALIWPRPARGVEPNTSQEAKAVEATILRSRRIDAEAAYTFDTSLLSTVYINDPRGGGLTPEALATIQEVRQDPTIRADQVGELDYMQAVIEWRKRNYELYIAELWSKQAAGPLTAEEQAILEGKDFLPTPAPSQEPVPATLSTTPPLPSSSRVVAYPGPNPMMPVVPPTSSPVADYPAPDPATPVLRPVGPTPHPTSLPPLLMAPYRGLNPAILKPESFEITIMSVEIEGDVAKAVVSKSGVTSEMVLVKVDGQWYIAGGRLLKFEP